jgi:hypothetical protein
MSFEQEFEVKGKNGKTYFLKVKDHYDGRVVSDVVGVNSYLKNEIDDLKHDLNILETKFDLLNDIDIETLLKYLRSNANTLDEIVKKLDS